MHCIAKPHHLRLIDQDAADRVGFVQSVLYDRGMFDIGVYDLAGLLPDMLGGPTAVFD